MPPGAETFVVAMIFVFGGLFVLGDSLAASRPRWIARIVLSVLVAVVLLNTGNIGRYAFERVSSYVSMNDYLRRFVMQFGVVSLSLFVALAVEYAVRAFRRD